MKKLLWLGAVVCLAPTAALAQSPFNGTWKIDFSKTQYPSKPEVFLLRDGILQCNSCVPPTKERADGQDHEVRFGCANSSNIKVVDKRTVQFTDKLDGRVTSTRKFTVSQDGNTLTVDALDNCKVQSKPETATLQYARLTKGPVGSHIISGSWRMTKQAEPDHSVLVTLRVERGMLYYSDTIGQSFAAKLGGPSVLVKGDPHHTTVAVRLIGKNTLVSTYRVNGKITDHDRTTVSADGKTITQVSHNARLGTYHITAEKQ